MSSFLWIALFGALVGALLFYWITKFILKFKLKRRFDRASEGEFEAQHLLAEHGYQIEQVQKTAKLSMWINEELFSYLVRPDAFATKGNLKFLVEIKTGKIATNPKNTSTRRQLLEYFHGFEVDGILLVDADLRKIHRIHFDLKSLEIESKNVKDPLEKLKKKVKVLLSILYVCILNEMMMR